ncbi:MAG: hypothetical protein A3B66_07085 [Alphaproteobacteria bacterium RIFCSPHIGHO2_02_FULL_46_13]|nr:MAG: hypothetical protein A3B66_07085 [Alphaproteobacteria bacterium RIFCSPHIGHO2_02_FULL_46_13]
MSRYLIALSAFTFLTTPAYADAIAVENSKIIKAIVYTDRATVTREAKVSVPAGSHSITFKGLPTTILPDSLRAEGEALAKVKFGAVTYKEVMAEEIAEPRKNELNAQIETLNDQLNILNGEKAALDAKRTFLTTIGTQAALRTNENIAEMNLKPEQWTAAAQTLFTSLNDVQTASVANNAKVRDLNKKILALQNELNDLGNGQYSTYTVTIPLETPTSTELTLDLSYQVSNASWNPVYDARIDTETAKLQLIQYGAVRQNSGEEWTGVALTLSTAQPQRGTGLPDLQPLWVNIFNPVAYGGAISSMSNRDMASDSAMPVPAAPQMLAKSAAPAEMVKEKAEFVTANITTGGFVSEYKIPGPASITADGTETKVMVGAFDTENTLQVHIKPQISTEAFLVAKAKLKGESPILPGEVSLFRDGAFVGKSSVPLLRPDEDYALYFGADDQVSVKRKILKDEKTDGGMIMRDNVQERHFVTEIQNLHSKPVAIVLQETTPVGQNDEITSDILKDVTTAGYTPDTNNIKGLLQWTFDLDAKAKKDMKLGWKVAWPKDSQISGL